MNTIKEDLKEGPLWVSADCSRDGMGREVASVIVGALNSEKYRKPHLVHVDFLEKVDSAAVARLINDALGKSDPQFDGKRAKTVLPDAAPYMVKAGRDLPICFPLMLHLTCLAHGLH